MFTLATAGLGLELIDDGNASGAGWGTGIFFAITSLASLFAGGMIAGRLAGTPLVPSAAIHGLVVWSLVLLGVAWMSVSATGSLLSGAGRAVSAAGSTVGSVAGASGTAIGDVVSAVAPDIENLQMPDVRALVPDSIEQDLRQITANQNLTPEQLAAQARSIAQTVIDQRDLEQARAIVVSAGRRMLRNPGDADAIFTEAADKLTADGGPLGAQQFAELKTQLQQRYGVSEQEATTTVDRWQQQYVEARDGAIQSARDAYDTVAKQVNDAAAAAEEAAKAAADATARASWWAAFGALVGLFAAAAGAVFGRPNTVGTGAARV